MTFDDIVDDVADQLDLTSADAITRIGRAVNKKYKEVTASIGMQLTRHTEVQAATTPGVRMLTFSGIEKIISLVDRTVSPPRVITEVTYQELLAKGANDSDTVHSWAQYSCAAGSVTVFLDINPQNATTMYAEGYARAVTLSGTQEPAFSESYHDVLSEGVLVLEFRKKGLFTEMKAAKEIFEERMSQLRLWMATSAHRDLVQGGRRNLNTIGVGGGGTGSSSINGAANWTQTGLITFNRTGNAVGSRAPFVVVAGSERVPNLKVDTDFLQVQIFS
jgi:hypothetical protein